MQDIKWLSKFLFEKSSKMTVEEGEAKLKDVLSYYEDILQVSKATRVDNSGNYFEYYVYIMIHCVS